VELTKTRNRWSGVRIISVSVITPQPRQAQRPATGPLPGGTGDVSSQGTDRVPARLPRERS
jgi:hypothetical protein